MKYISNLILFIALTSCSQQSHELDNSRDKKTTKGSLKRDSTANNNRRILTDSLARNTALHREAVQAIACLFKPIKAYGITAQRLATRDSVLFASENQLFVHPLGRFSSATQVIAKFPVLTYSYRDEDPDSTGIVRVYTFKNGTSFFRMFVPPESGSTLELSSGIITTPDIKIFDKVYVGMTKSDFLNIFFKRRDYPTDCACSVYSFAYEVDSQVQHFTFQRDRLVKIQFTSYYTVQ